jgi:bifunctional enzyme CysN/CysC
MAEQPLVQGKTYDIKLLTGRVAGAVTAVRHRVDVNSLHRVDASTLALNEIGRCELTLEQPVLADSYKEFRSTGSFIVVDRLTHATVAAGMMLPPEQQQVHELHKSAQVSTTQKARRFGQKAAIVYIKGEVNAARTLVYTLEKALFDDGRAVATLEHNNLQYSEGFKAPLALALKANGLLVLTDTDTGHSDLTLILADLPEQGGQVAAALEQLREHKIL